MISLKNSDQIAKMRVAGALLYEVHQKIRAEIKPGVTTWDLDAYAESLIRKAGAIPSFKGYQDYGWDPVDITIDQEVYTGGYDFGK